VVYLKNSVDFVTNEDVISGLIKAAVFGFIIALMGCFHGFQSRGGARGVSKPRPMPSLRHRYSSSQRIIC